MKASSYELLKKVLQWITLADEDLLFAQHGLTITKKPPHRLIAFHAQQCVEKYLKAFLVFKNVDFPHTHNISTLLELCSKYNAWITELKDAKQLTAFAISSRYPGEDEEVTSDEAVNAISTATDVRKVVRNALIKEGLNLGKN